MAPVLSSMAAIVLSLHSEQPRVLVPLIDAGRVAPVGLRQSLYRRHRFGAGDCGPVLEFEARPARDRAREVEGSERVVFSPQRAVPFEPLAPGRDVAEVIAVPRRET